MSCLSMKSCGNGEGGGIGVGAGAGDGAGDGDPHPWTASSGGATMQPLIVRSLLLEGAQVPSMRQKQCPLLLLNVKMRHVLFTAHFCWHAEVLTSVECNSDTPGTTLGTAFTPGTTFHRVAPSVTGKKKASFSESIVLQRPWTSKWRRQQQGRHSVNNM